MPVRRGQALPVRLDNAGGRHEGGHQQLHKRGLARPVRAQQPYEAGRAQVQADVLQRLLAVRICHSDMLNSNFHRVGILSAWDAERIPLLCEEVLEPVCGFCVDPRRFAV